MRYLPIINKWSLGGQERVYQLIVVNSNDHWTLPCFVFVTVLGTELRLPHTGSVYYIVKLRPTLLTDKQTK